MQWTIEPLLLHRVQVPGPEVYFQRAFDATVTLAIHAFLLRGDDGTVCLVDTGLPTDHSALDAGIRARKGPQSGFDDVGPGLQAQLTARGATPSAVLLTSFGPYATGGLDTLAQVPVHASARGLRDLEQPEEAALAHGVAPAVRARLGCARPVTDEAQVLPGLTVREVGIHHPASAAILVDTANGRIAIADPVFVAGNLRDGIALGVAEQVDGWHRMVRALGRRCDAIMPIHDLEPVALPRSAWHPVLAADPR